MRDKEVALIDWAYQCYKVDELQNFLSDHEDVNMKEFEKLVNIWVWYLECELNFRPAIKQVIWMMEGIVVTPPPHSLYSSIRG